MRKFNFSVCVLALVVMACGGAPVGGPQEPVEPQPGEGVMQLPLVSTSTDGQRYRLVGATFEITGPRSVTITDTTPDTLSVALPAGSYTIRLNGQWTMERMGPPAEQVQATLVSPNPLAFTVDEGQTHTVRFLFKFSANGNADVGISVDSGGYVSGSIAFDALISYGNYPNPYASLVGQTVPFVISWETATLTRERMGSDYVLTVQPGPASVQFGGPYSALLHDRVAPGFQGAFISPFMLRSFSGGGVLFTGLRLNSIRGEQVELEVGAAGYQGALDADGYPTPRPFEYSPSGGPGQGISSIKTRVDHSSYLGAQGPMTGTVSPR